jgi:predicted Holliday junction resolvase-like endonuclease
MTRWGDFIDLIIYNFNTTIFKIVLSIIVIFSLFFFISKIIESVDDRNREMYEEVKKQTEEQLKEIEESKIESDKQIEQLEMERDEIRAEIDKLSGKLAQTRKPRPAPPSFKEIDEFFDSRGF